MVNPAETNGLAVLVADLYERLTAGEKRIAALEGQRAPYKERAQVTAYSGGTQCTVTYPSGVTRALPFYTTYTPTVGDQVVVENSPAWSGVTSKVSA